MYSVFGGNWEWHSDRFPSFFRNETDNLLSSFQLPYALTVRQSMYEGKKTTFSASGQFSTWENNMKDPVLTEHGVDR